MRISLAFTVMFTAALLSGCGVYIARGGGSYTFVGAGTNGIARRCSAAYAAEQDQKAIDEARKKAELHDRALIAKYDCLAAIMAVGVESDEEAAKLLKKCQDDR